MHAVNGITTSLPGLFDPSNSIKAVEVAKKYDLPEGEPIVRSPEYTYPGGPNNYHCSKLATAWTQGFFPGLIWLLAERQKLLPTSIEKSYSRDLLISLARRYQNDFEYMARPAQNHDQGFRFQLSFGRDHDLTGDEHAKEVVIEAAESLVDRYNPVVGSIRSWDQMFPREGGKSYPKEEMDKHFLVIIDNMMNLDLLYEATKLTGDERYANVATRQAEVSMHTHVRPDFTTYHVVNYDQQTGDVIERITAQGYADNSVWSRGQAWGIYGYAQCALRTGRKDFIATCRALTDKFLELLGDTGVPLWDFKAPRPCPYDASAGCIAARGMQMLYQLLLPTEPKAAEEYLRRANLLIEDIIRECMTPAASLKDGKVDFGKDGWESILAHSTINGNPKAPRQIMDHGLVYADYYFVEFGNEALKIQMAKKT